MPSKPISVANPPEPGYFRILQAAEELARIQPDGSCLYHWDAIRRTAAQWKPGEVTMGVCLAKLLEPLMPSDVAAEDVPHG